MHWFGGNRVLGEENDLMLARREEKSAQTSQLLNSDAWGTCLRLRELFQRFKLKSRTANDLSIIFPENG
jgi:hypothetical protein